jgi:hypothetical protein
VPSATAILARFLHHAELVTIAGPSFRVKDRATQAVKKANLPKKSTKSKEAACRKAER